MTSVWLPEAPSSVQPRLVVRSAGASPSGDTAGLPARRAQCDPVLPPSAPLSPVTRLRVPPRGERFAFQTTTPCLRRCLLVTRGEPVPPSRREEEKGISTSLSAPKSPPSTGSARHSGNWERPGRCGALTSAVLNSAAAGKRVKLNRTASEAPCVTVTAVARRSPPAPSRTAPAEVGAHVLVAASLTSRWHSGLDRVTADVKGTGASSRGVRRGVPGPDGHAIAAHGCHVGPGPHRRAVQSGVRHPRHSALTRSLPGAPRPPLNRTTTLLFQTSSGVLSLLIYSRPKAAFL